MSPERKREKGKVKIVQVRVPIALLEVVEERRRDRDVFLHALYTDAMKGLLSELAVKGVVFYAVYGGKNTKRVCVWLPAEIHDAAAAAASTCGVSLASFCYTAFCRYFKYTSRSCVLSKSKKGR